MQLHAYAHSDEAVIPSLLIELEHHIRNLDILFVDVVAGDLENDVFLVVRDFLLADVFDELGHPDQHC